MAKQVVDAAQVVKDMRKGLSDSALMVKYNLSPIGLARLIKRLTAIGAVRQISARDLLRDVRAGVTNTELMSKYQLSARALRNLFHEMRDAGIVFFKERESTFGKKRISVREMVDDIGRGATELELMKKHSLSPRGLQSTFWKLVNAGVLSWDELLKLYPDLDESVTLQKVRQWTRSYPIFSIQVYEQSNPQNKGKVKDLSETGVGTTGIWTKAGNRMTLVLVPDEYMELPPMSVEVLCKWFSSGEEGRPCFAGFQIIKTNEDARVNLEELLQLMTLTF